MLRAAIFDLDGLLIDSEPLWQRAEREQFATVGLQLGNADFIETTGLRIDEVVALRHRQHPWKSPTVAELTERIVTRVIALIDAEGPAKPGIAHAIELCTRAGLRLAVASSSPQRVIEAALAKLGIRDHFREVRSADDELFGKPHPAVLLRTAEHLDVSAVECIVLEDSVNGLIAAKAARMTCVVVPERGDPRFVLADVVLRSLEELDADTLAALVARAR